MVSDIVTIKPDMRVIHPDYGDITEDVARELAAIRREDHENLVKTAHARQQAIVHARPGQAIIQKNYALKAEIDPAVYAHWRMKYGKSFWKHELDWFLKKNEQCRVKSVSAQPRIVVPDTSGVRGKRGRWAL